MYGRMGIRESNSLSISVFFFQLNRLLRRNAAPPSVCELNWILGGTNLLMWCRF